MYPWHRAAPVETPHSPIHRWLPSKPQGLVESCNRYDIHRGTAFTTAAFQWIRNRCHRYVQLSARSVYIPKTTQENIYRVRRQIEIWTRDHSTQNEFTALQVGTRGVAVQGRSEALFDNLLKTTGLSPKVLSSVLWTNRLHEHSLEGATAAELTGGAKRNKEKAGVEESLADWLEAAQADDPATGDFAVARAMAAADSHESLESVMRGESAARRAAPSPSAWAVRIRQISPARSEGSLNPASPAEVDDAFGQMIVSEMSPIPLETVARVFNGLDRPTQNLLRVHLGIEGEGPVEDYHDRTLLGNLLLDPVPATQALTEMVERLGLKNRRVAGLARRKAILTFHRALKAAVAVGSEGAVGE